MWIKFWRNKKNNAALQWIYPNKILRIKYSSNSGSKFHQFIWFLWLDFWASLCWCQEANSSHNPAAALKLFSTIITGVLISQIISYLNSLISLIWADDDYAAIIVITTLLTRIMMMTVMTLQCNVDDKCFIMDRGPRRMFGPNSIKVVKCIARVAYSCFELNW